MRTTLEMLREFRQSAQLESAKRKAEGDITSAAYYEGKADAYDVAVSLYAHHERVGQ